jgi:hypothetical protein
MRGFLAGLLALIGLLLVPLADLGVWAQRELLPTAAFTDLSTDVLREPDVRDALAQRLTDELIKQQPALLLAENLLRTGVVEVIGTDQFEQVFRASVADMHAQVERGDDQLQLNLDAVLPVVRAQVANLDETLADQVPTHGIPPITVVTRDDVPELWAGVQTGRRASWAFPILTLVLLAAAVLVAERRAVMLVVVGVGLAVVSIALVLVIRLGRDPLSHVVGSQVSLEAFDAGYDTVTDSFVTQTLVLAGVGIVTAIGGVAASLRRGGDARPHGWA